MFPNIRQAVLLTCYGGNVVLTQITTRVDERLQAVTSVFCISANEIRVQRGKIFGRQTEAEMREKYRKNLRVSLAIAEYTKETSKRTEETIFALSKMGRF